MGLETSYNPGQDQRRMAGKGETFEQQRLADLQGKVEALLFDQITRESVMGIAMEIYNEETDHGKIMEHIRTVARNIAIEGMMPKTGQKLKKVFEIED